MSHSNDFYLKNLQWIPYNENCICIQPVVSQISLHKDIYINPFFSYERKEETIQELSYTHAHTPLQNIHNNFCDSSI